MLMIRNHNIHSHFGANDFHRYYKRHGGTLDRKQIGFVLKNMNLKIADEILKGYSFKMPSRMGILAITKKKEYLFHGIKVIKL